MENEEKVNEAKEPKEKSKVLTIVLIVLLVVFLCLATGLVVGGLVYKWQNDKTTSCASDCDKEKVKLGKQINDLKDEVEIAVSAQEEAEMKVAEAKKALETDESGEIAGCEFDKDVALKSSTQYGIFGDDEFDTVVCGYASLEDVVVFDTAQTNVSFNILKFADEGFKASLQSGIDEGNSVNNKAGEEYQLGLGCSKGGGIEGVQFETGVEYMDQATQDAILGSTKESPVRLVLSFGNHLGRGCQCCNLAHQVSLY